MLQKSTIISISKMSRPLAGLLLIVFSLAITPKLILHNLFANHKDYSRLFSTESLKHTQVQKGGINCHCVNLVVENPFAGSGRVVNSVTPTPDTQTFADHTNQCYSIPALQLSLRGPPALI